MFFCKSKIGCDVGLGGWPARNTKKRNRSSPFVSRLISPGDKRAGFINPFYKNPELLINILPCQA